MWDRLRSLSLEAWALWLTLGLTLIAALDPALRYAKYLPAPVLLGLFLVSRQRRLYLPNILLPFLLLIAATILTGFRTTPAGWKDAAFMASYCLPFMLFRAVPLPMAAVNLAVFLTYLGATFLSGQYQFSFSFVKSATFAESPMSFVAGLFFIYWLTRTKDRTTWAMLALNAVFLLLSMKRAALLGLIAAGVVLVLPAAWRRVLLHPAVMVAVNLGLLAGFVLLGSGHLDAWAASHGVMLRCPPEAVQCFDATNGRLALIADIAKAMQANPWQFLMLGEGAGSGYSMMHSVAVQTGNLHNDLIKIAFEFGLLVYVAFAWLLYRSGDRLTLALAIYLNVIFCFDNVLIYAGVMMFLGLLRGQARLVDRTAQGPGEGAA